MSGPTFLRVRLPSHRPECRRLHEREERAARLDDVMPTGSPRRFAATSSSPEGRPADDRRGRAHDRDDPSLAPASRRAAVEATAGALTATYAPGELASLREDWPA
jgi:hypothetical protein